MADNKETVAETAKDAGSSAAVVKTDGFPADPKAFRAARLDHDLHVSLIMRIDALPKSKAEIVAYHEGRAGLNVRLQR